jgi:hypothetical protein
VTRHGTGCYSRSWRHPPLMGRGARQSRPYPARPPPAARRVWVDAVTRPHPARDGPPGSKAARGDETGKACSAFHYPSLTPRPRQKKCVNERDEEGGSVRVPRLCFCARSVGLGLGEDRPFIVTLHCEWARRPPAFIISRLDGSTRELSSAFCCCFFGVGIYQAY